MLRGNSSMFPPGVRMVHLHLINPYGASYILKENEQNADQLKNEPMYYTLDYDNPILQRLIDQIDIPNLGNVSVRQKAFAVFAQLIADYGEEAVNLALKTGQGKRPQGIAYFGPSKSWSSQTEEYVIDKYIPYATNILLIDWHTAVGPYGAWSFVPIDDESETAFKRWAPNDLMSSYDLGLPTDGRLPYATIKVKTKARRVIRGFWEAGTYNVTMETNAMFMLRLYCRFYSNMTDPFCKDIISKTQEYFYPQADEWKKLTYNAINNVLPKVLSGFAAELSIGIKLIVSDLCIILGVIVGLLWFRIWNDFLECLRVEIGQNVKNSVTQLLTSNFSTTTQIESLLSCTVIMDTFQKYFKYKSYVTMCGIRNVHFMGTSEDWKLLRYKTTKLKNFTVPNRDDFGSYIDGLLPIIDQFIQTYQDNVDNQFWNKVMDVEHVGRGGSGR
ncbi:unnamed protein product [Rotaria sp. Silwood2]|nr:unnamed protein product [Rotaria sp. Silwood2]